MTLQVIGHRPDEESVEYPEYEAQGKERPRQELQSRDVSLIPSWLSLHQFSMSGVDEERIFVD